MGGSMRRLTAGGASAPASSPLLPPAAGVPPQASAPRTAARVEARARERTAGKRMVPCYPVGPGAGRTILHEQPFLVFLVQILVIDGFAHHTTGTDRHLARYLRSVGAR